jgi:hypothetical protein
MGVSGAQVLVLGDVAVKVNGGHRLNEQARWLLDNQSPGVVTVIGEWEGGYAMERLEPPPNPINPKDIIGILTSYVWNRPPVVAPDWSTIKKYGLERAKLYWNEAYTKLETGLDRISAYNLTRVLVHGDPTAENVMWRPDEGLVLIDPIPARPEAPDLLALDLGKILQSACGYEHARVGEQVYGVQDQFLYGFEDEERDAAKVFCLYHLLRMLPYLSSDDMRERIKETVGENVLNL